MCAKVLSAALALATCSDAPLAGKELSKRSDGVAVVNEPCYVHDSSCDGYPVCCVKAGTCVSVHSGTFSSNNVYYEGGCQSLSSRKKAWNSTYGGEGCTQQGECLIQHLLVCNGAVTKSQFIEDVPESTLDRFMKDSCRADCPTGGYGGHSYGSGDDDDEYNGTVTTTTRTTTTTSIYPLSGSVELALSNPDGVAHRLKMKMSVTCAIASLAGYGTDHSFTTVEMPAELSGTFTTTYRLDVSNAEPVTWEQAKSNFDGTMKAEVDEHFAMFIGSCYALTVSAPETQTPSGAVGKSAGALAALAGSVALLG